MKSAQNPNKRPTSIVITPKLHDEIKAIAKRQHRSVNAQICVFLSKAVGRRRTGEG